MPTTLPYLPSPGSVDTALTKIKAAARPTKFTTDFVKTKLQIKGGTGGSIPAFMKKLGMVNADGTPTARYDRYRNDGTSGHAIAEAIKHGYKSLYEVNEYAHDLSDANLKGLILQVTGAEKGNQVANLTYGTFKRLKARADFEADSATDEESADQAKMPPNESIQTKGMNLAYTINLNLPASTNPEVFNAIFKSLKEHLLSD